MALWDTIRDTTRRALAQLAPAVADAPPPAPAPVRGRAVAATDSATSDLFAGRFFGADDPVKHVLDGGWEPRAPYSDLMREMLGRTGLARRVLALRALDATREGWSTRFPGLAAKDALAASSRLESMQATLAVQLRFYLALFKAEQDGESIIVMGIDDGQTLDQPLDMTRVKTVWWLKVFARSKYTPGPLSPPTSPNFDLPEYYDVHDFYQPFLASLEGARRNSGTMRVHHTRVLRFSTEEGYSRLDEVGQALEDYFSAMRSGRRASSIFSVAVWSIKNWIEKFAADKDDEAVKRLSLQHMAMRKLGAVVTDLGNEEFKWQGQPSSGLGDLIDKSAGQLCAWTGYPAMLLFGQDPAGFSTGAEVIRYYYDTVRTVQRLQVEPPLRRLLSILMVAEDGPKAIYVEPDSWAVDFRPLRVLNAEEQARVRDTVARTLIALKNEQIIDRDESRASLSREGDDVPDVRLSSDAFSDQRERLEVGIVQALGQLILQYYGDNAPAAALRTFVAAVVPELAAAAPSMFTDKGDAAEELVDAAGPTDLEAERAALAADPEGWRTADDLCRMFSVSKRTLRKYRAETRGALVDPGPGRYRWIAPDGRPKYLLSEVRPVLEGGGPTPPLGTPTTDALALDELFPLIDLAALADAYAAVPDDAGEEYITRAYERFHQVVNMSAAELEAWRDNPCSREASLSREPLERNLRLLRTPRDRWTAATARSAMRTVSFVERMLGAEQGEPAKAGCPSARDISLRNWARRP